MFATDRDLLALEPNLFRDLVWAGQRLTRGTSSISGTTLTCSTPEVLFDAAGVTTGHVVVANGIGHEVISRLSTTQLSISRPRATSTSPVLPPTAATNVEAWVVTFAPQMEVVHRQVLRMAGIDVGLPANTPGLLTESSIVNGPSLTRLEVLGTLHLLYTAAAAGTPRDSALSTRAAMYRHLFREEREHATAQIDTNGDGIADVTRSLHIAPMTR